METRTHAGPSNRSALRVGLVWLGVLMGTGCLGNVELAKAPERGAGSPVTPDQGTDPPWLPDAGMPDAGSPQIRPFVGTYVEGGIVRARSDEKKLALVLTGGSFADGATTILDALANRGLKASFFLTGDFVRSFPEVIRRIVRDGHYLGPHSDQHLQYCDWSNRNQTLVTHTQFTTDLQKNISDLVGFGFPRDRMKYWIPPSEWYNQEISRWSGELGMVLHTYTPGSWSERDWYIDSDPNFTPSQTLYDHILEYERSQPNGLNGFLLILHIGTHPDRTDKFHRFVPQLLDVLVSRGYVLQTVEQLLAGAPAIPP